MSEHEAHALVDRRLADQVVVVEYEDVLLRRVDERVDEERQRGLADRGAGRRDGGFEGRRHLDAGPAQRGRDIEPEPRGIVVLLVEREPGERDLILDREPFGEQRRLASARRRRHQVQTAVQPMAQPLDEAAPWHVPRPDPRRLDLRQ
jgi:hypothetical protein